MTPANGGPVVDDEPAIRRLLRDREQIHRTPKEYAVLAELARFPGRVVTHVRLLRTVWPTEIDGQVGYLRVVVRNLRGKIEPDPARPTIVVGAGQTEFR